MRQPSFGGLLAKIVRYENSSQLVILLGHHLIAVEFAENIETLCMYYIKRTRVALNRHLQEYNETCIRGF